MVGLHSYSSINIIIQVVSDQNGARYGKRPKTMMRLKELTI